MAVWSFELGAGAPVGLGADTKRLSQIFFPRRPAAIGSCFGPDFTRNQDGGDRNGLLNYGYTVLRAVVARAICAAGLHPTIGIFHANRANVFALADDLMEPYRPLVDQLVHDLALAGQTEVGPDTKAILAGFATLDLPGPLGISPLSVQVQRLVHSLATSFETGVAALELPESCLWRTSAMQEADDALA